jgi:hypothetical protein
MTSSSNGFPAHGGNMAPHIVIDESLWLQQYVFSLFLVGLVLFALVRFRKVCRRNVVIPAVAVPLQSVFVVDDDIRVSQNQTRALASMARGDDVVEFYQFAPEYVTRLNSQMAVRTVRGSHLMRGCAGAMYRWLDSFLDVDLDSFLVETGPDGLFGYHGVFTCAPIDVKHPFLTSEPVYEPGLVGAGRRFLDLIVQCFTCQPTRYHYTCHVVYDASRTIQRVRMVRSEESPHSQPVSYLHLIRGKFSVREYVHEDHRVAFSMTPYVNVDLKMSELDGFALRCDATVKGIGMGSIEHNGTKLGVEDISRLAPYIHSFITSYTGTLFGRPILTSAYSAPPAPQIQYVDPLATAFESSRKIGTFLFDERSLPLDVPKAVILRDRVAEELAKAERLEKPRDQSERRVSTDLMFQLLAVPKGHRDCKARDASVVPFKTLLNEFLELVVPDTHVHTVRFQDHSEVFARQTRPSQVANRVEAKDDLFMPGNEKVMLKNEAAKFGGAPRIVYVFTSPLNTEQGALYGALSKVLKLSKHYGFLPPKELQDAMSEFALYKHKRVTDFSKMDATVNELTRWCEECFIKRAMHPEELEHALDVFRSTHGSVARGKNGVKFDIGYTRGTGSNDTSLSNTYLCELFIWLTYRRYGYSASEAFEMPSLSGGDDAALVNADAASIEYASSFLGFDVKATIIPPYGTFDFLSKFYICASSVDGFLLPDPLRTLISFSVTHIVDVPSEQVASRKGLSFLKTWGHEIPILSAIARYHVRRCTINPRYDVACSDALGYYDRFFKDSEQVFNSNVTIDQGAACDFIVTALSLGGVRELYAIEEMYEKATCDEQLSRLKWCPIDYGTTKYYTISGNDYYSPPAGVPETITPRIPEDNQVKKNGKKTRKKNTDKNVDGGEDSTASSSSNPTPHGSSRDASETSSQASA